MAVLQVLRPGRAVGEHHRQPRRAFLRPGRLGGARPGAQGTRVAHAGGQAGRRSDHGQRFRAPFPVAQQGGGGEPSRRPADRGDRATGQVPAADQAHSWVEGTAAGRQAATGQDQATPPLNRRLAAPGQSVPRVAWPGPKGASRPALRPRPSISVVLAGRPRPWPVRPAQPRAGHGPRGHSRHPAAVDKAEPRQRPEGSGDRDQHAHDDEQASTWQSSRSAARRPSGRSPSECGRTCRPSAAGRAARCAILGDPSADPRTYLPMTS